MEYSPLEKKGRQITACQDIIFGSQFSDNILLWTRSGDWEEYTLKKRREKLLCGINLSSPGGTVWHRTKLNEKNMYLDYISLINNQFYITNSVSSHHRPKIFCRNSHAWMRNKFIKFFFSSGKMLSSSANMKPASIFSNGALLISKNIPDFLLINWWVKATTFAK